MSSFGLQGGSRGPAGAAGAAGATGATGPAGGGSEYRLSLVSGDPVPTSDQTAKSTLYLTPYNGQSLRIFNAGNFEYIEPGETSLAISGLTAGKNYDVFWKRGTGLILGTAWTDDLTRAVALTRTKGVLRDSTDSSAILLGTVRAASATTLEDSAAKRNVSNVYNPVPRPLSKNMGDSLHSYNSATTRQYNADGTAQVEFVQSVPGYAEASAMANVVNVSATSVYPVVAVGYDSTTVQDVYTFLAGSTALDKRMAGQSGGRQTAAGWHRFVLQEQVQAPGSAEFNYGSLRGWVLS